MNTPAAPAPAAPSPPGPPPPLVLVHGLWDTPRLFRRLQRQLGERRDPLLIPQLPHRFGLTPIETLAEMLGGHIEAAFGRTTAVDVLGFSMGGVIARTWIQLLGGHGRTRRFISVGSPQQGTLTAQPWPRRLAAGIADMKFGSALLQRLNRDLSPLERIECRSYYCSPDLMVLPGWRAVLPVGPKLILPVWTHQQLLRHPAALEVLSAELLRP